MPSLNKNLLKQHTRVQYDAAQRSSSMMSGPLRAPRMGGSTGRGRPVIGAHRARRSPVDPGQWIDDLCEGICFGHDQWRIQARFDDIVIMGVSAQHGRLVGPDLDDLVDVGLRSRGTTVPDDVRNAVASGLGRQWKRWADSVRIPGLPWYPSFAAFPGPVAPPTPNVPTPLIATSSDTAALGPQALEQAMGSGLRGASAQTTALMKALATSFALVVQTWLPAQMIINVMGTGPIPSFAPPFSPVGPVVNGSVISTPGHLMS